MTTEPEVGRQGGRQRRRLTATVTDLERPRQRAFLVGVLGRGSTAAEAERSLEELALLVDTAGADPVDSELVRARCHRSRHLHRLRQGSGVGRPDQSHRHRHRRF